MPYQCVKCSRIIPTGSKEIFEGCKDCKSKFFFYIKEDQIERLNSQPVILEEKEKLKIEKDIRQIAGIENESMPVILDFESVRVVGEGKFELDLSKVFNKKRPLVYKIEEGKYMIDLGMTFRQEEDKKE